MLKTEDIEKIIKSLLSRFMPIPLSLGVDTSKDCVKLALTREEPQGAITLLDYRIVPLTPDIKGAPDPTAVISDILREDRLSSGCKVKFVVSGREVDAKRISLPMMPKEEVAQALRWEAKDHFLLNIEESMLDFEVLQEVTADDGTKSLEVIATIANNRLIDEKISLFKDLQVSLSVVVPKAYALRNLYRLTKEDSKEPVALIDIGSSTTTIVVIKNKKIRFIRQVGCAGKDFTNALSGTLVSDKGKIELTIEQAEEIKKNTGIPDESVQGSEEGISPQQVRVMLRPIVEKLASEIKRSFDYYTSQFSEGAVAKVFLSGGTSKLKNIRGELFQKLSVAVEPLDVSAALNVKITGKAPESLREDFPFIAAAIGAAISNSQGLNLIPISYKTQKTQRIKSQSIRAVLIVPALILAAVYLFNSAHEGVLRKLLAAREPQWQKLQELQDLHARIVQKDAIIDHTLKNQAPLYYIFKALSNSLLKPIYLKSLIVSDKASTLAVKGVVFETAQGAETTLAEFMKALERSPFFNDVTLDSSRDTNMSGRKAMEFRLSCQLEKL
ncbi:MAG: pilus assembly protein PilM [Candidatus Omnitrophica bacterium]|nr:pilus assembly protein PilM [Candidatus Omnitrophota bacterium]